MTLDPEDWDDFRKHAHNLLDACIDHIENSNHQSWKSPTCEAIENFNVSLPQKGKSTKDIVKLLIQNVLPYSTGNTHPRFWGWVHGTGLADSLLAEMAASAMNSNCGGRNHGAVYIERNVIEWCKGIFGFPENSSGLLSTGTSQSTLISLQCARTKILGDGVLEEGLYSFPKLKIYCAEGTHTCIEKAARLLGHGSDSLQKTNTQSDPEKIDPTILKRQINNDKKAGFTPLCIVATAGSASTGAFDNIEELASIAKSEKIWLHIDGAFGAWAHIARDPWCQLTKGIEKADSLAFDFHKWMYMQYACGGIIIRDAEIHYKSFCIPSSASYLSTQGLGLNNAHPWYCNYGPDLSRGFRALKVWTSIQKHGLDKFSEAISQNCLQAAYMSDLVNASEELILLKPVTSNVCVFGIKCSEIDTESERTIHENMAYMLQQEQATVFSTVKINGRTALRAAIVNHRTTFTDIEIAISAVIKNIRHCSSLK